MLEPDRAFVLQHIRFESQATESSEQLMRVINASKNDKKEGDQKVAS